MTTLGVVMDNVTDIFGLGRTDLLCCCCCCYCCCCERVRNAAAVQITIYLNYP